MLLSLFIESKMEYKKDKKRFSLAFKEEVALKALSNKRKLEESKPADLWNAKKRKWTKPSSQIGYKAVTVREIFKYLKISLVLTHGFHFALESFTKKFHKMRG